MSLLRAPPLALYVHLPWCVSKCPYCDFNSHALEGSVPEQRYVSALLADLDGQLADVRGREIVSCFLGGGTPSLFSPAAIDRLLTGARARLRFAANAEITMEANPGTVEHGRFGDYRAAGVTRVSLGGQSFEPRHLQVLGRIHSADETRRAVEELVAAGLENFNIDLMYGLPGQSVGQSLADIDAALSLGPVHLSHYQLTLEPGTVFFHRPPALPDEDACWEMQCRCQERLAAASYEQYEVSGYARAGYRCVHNLNYWQFGDYLGVGAGAHGKLTDATTGRVERTAALRQPRQYMDAFAPMAGAMSGSDAPRQTPARHDRRTVQAEDLPFEYMLNALRLTDGFTLRHFEERTGVTVATVESILTRAVSRGLLIRTGEGAWQPTTLGMRFLNDLQAEFLVPGRVARAPQEANLR